MLISQVSDVDNGETVKEAATDIHNYEYQTADDLYRLMANNNNFDGNKDNSLTAGDLVLLYKNIDIGSQLMSNANQTKIKKPNQHVETIVHDADPDTDSDVSEIYSNEDLHNLFMINDERIDLLNNNSSLDNVLCHKYGDIELQTSVSTDYDKHFLFKDPYIKEQLRSLHLMASSTAMNTVLPATLLDYICCKRLEDNYNFYMDGIIRYVKHTIEQLKRISNGDYLTDKAKEKWREVVRKVDESHNSDTRVLAMSTSIPLHVERKVSGQTSIWNDIAHSEVDVRSLSKILEKKIVVEIPKLICGSYNLFSKCYADNLIISCKREKKKRHKKEESTVNVVVQLQRSDSGHMLSKINSIMILQSTLPPESSPVKEILALPYKESDNVDDTFDIFVDETEDSKKEINATEIDNRCVVEAIESPVTEVICTEISDTESETNIDSAIGYESDNHCQILSHRSSNQESDESNDVLKDILDSKSVISIVQREVTYMTTPDELQLAMRRLNLHDSLPEESEDASLGTNKKKSSTKIRIKSPYENKSFVIEEKKRKKLLEIREKREKKKIALSEICNITKHKYGKNAILPQASSSVTKLSISNKSFYNSIYGNNINDVKQPNTKSRKGHKKDVTFELPTEVSEVDFNDALSTPDKNSKKYINRSYYLDDAVTEIMFVEMKKEEKTDSIKEPESTSAASTDFCNKLNLLSQLMNQKVVPEGCSSTSYFSNQTPITQQTPVDKKVQNNNEKYNHKKLVAVQNTLKLTPENIQKNLTTFSKTDPQKLTSVECKKSIDKIYNLMTRQVKPNERKDPNVKLASFVLDKTTDKNTLVSVQDSFIVQGSDSGTSLKHRLTSSNPSCFSFGKFEVSKPKMANGTTETPAIPKVIISTKSQTPKVDTKRDRRKCVVVPTKTVPNNPLKAISQLLHEFDNVQRTRQKITEMKTTKKADVSEAKCIPRQNYLKGNLRPEQQIKEQCFESNDKYNKTTSRKAKRVETAQTAHLSVETKPYKVPRNKIIDIINEAKEARGEAVRGPSKTFSRLQSLSQPKKSYVQAHSEEYQTRNGKNLLADRLQKLAGVTVYVPEKHAGSTRSKQRRPELSLNASVKQSAPHMPPLEKCGKIKYSAGSSPDRKVHPLPLESSNKQNAADTNETLNKRMFAVESYVKNHYGHAATSPNRSPLRAHKARVPLLPKDIELASVPSTQTAEVSTELGNKLHIIINTMLNTKSAEPNLTSVREYSETDSKNNKDDESLAENPSRGDELLTESDYIIDVFEDKNVITAVENVAVDIKQQEKFTENTCNKENKINIQKIQFSSSTELELEKALYRKISAGNFQKRLRIRNLTLTPKHSLQQAVILQSGDAGSLLAKPKDLKLISSKSESISDFKMLPTISNTRLDWRFGKFPMQIATVGYVFPKYQSVKCQLHTNSHELINSVGTMSDKTIQCFKAGQVALQLEQSVQVNIKDSVIKSNMVDVTKYCNDLSKESERNLVVTEINHSCQKDDNQHNSNDTGKSKKTVQSTASGTESQNVLVTFDNSTEIETNFVKADVNTTSQIESQDVNYTTSLDMLVGLLNEIHKITTCEKHTSDTKEVNDEDKNKKLKTILNNNLVLENTVKEDTRHVMSMTSFDKIKQLKSRSKIHALNLSDCREQFVNAPQINLVQTNKISYTDKEVNVGIPEKNHVNAFTNVPSRFLPVTVNHSTTVTNSIIGFISEPSSHSIFPNMDYQSIHSHSSHESFKKIINLGERVSEGCSKKSIAGDQTREIFRSEEKFKVSHFERESIKQQKGNFPTTNNKSYGAADFDFIMRMKRDILVTLYSILVFTVFAALSFPEVLNRV